MGAIHDKSVVVLTPVYNDWESFAVLVGQLQLEAQKHGFRLQIVAIDDGSDVPCTLETTATIVRLTCNVGHQRALAIGLAFAHKHLDFDVLVVMDADGEDCPQHVAVLLEEHARESQAIIVAARARRSEGPLFRVLYQIYKLVFRALIGRPITFGNFALIPSASMGRLLVMPELWNHLAATYIRSRIPLRSISVPRGTRYAGSSKMNMPSLVTHGLSAISVFADILVARVLIGSTLLVALSGLGVATVVAVRFTTDLAIAGWATSSVGLLIVLSMQALLMSFVAAFLILSNRTQIPVSLLSEYRRFVSTVTREGQERELAP